MNRGENLCDMHLKYLCNPFHQCVYIYICIHNYSKHPDGLMVPVIRGFIPNDKPPREIRCCNVTGKPLSLPAPTPTTCPNKKRCVLWDKMHMSMIMGFILQRTA